MSTQTFPNIDDLLRVLNEATDRKRLRWTETADEDTFRATHDLGLIRIARDPSASRYVVTLVGEDGTTLEEYEPSGEGALRAIEALYKKARHQALDLDRKLKDYFDHLRSLAKES